MGYQPKFKYRTLTGYFLQDEASTDPGTFDYVSLPKKAASNFGLIPREQEEPSDDTQWERLGKDIGQLQNTAETKYKLLFLGRHGEGVHNVAERRYGTKAWDGHWSLLDGDEHGSWVDATLTDLGISQAQAAHASWEKQIAERIPWPESYYVSPLRRCCQTAQITFEGLHTTETRIFRPMIKELLRETMGEHTCDRRSTLSEIAEENQKFSFEEGFVNEDVLWDTKTRESDQQRNERLTRFLDDIFTNDQNTSISLTTHSGAITSILEVIGHRKFPVATGGVLPVLVEANAIA
ncbi:hypothetical protein N7492_008773 [Penicillium capsulatum]|uniref:Phosphoglycerate mutase n=1 Tax=Penicillium capsulatum TaxID=69766 RepID=A0A9W9HTP1_9EURO|nr:hypothetical protein N7492_008773 [Penicillium capsulatum]KAJ6106175.1 hypothetical protein N7512_009692 [Penicillium capsulatum]